MTTDPAPTTGLSPIVTGATSSTTRPKLAKDRAPNRVG